MPSAAVPLDATRPNAGRPSFLLLLAIALPLLLLRLGAKDVWEASEGRPLESAREMRAQGDYLVQYTNGAVDLTKPPVYAWCVVATSSILGDSTTAGRLPSVFAAIGCLGAVFVLARRRGGPRAGFLAAFLLLVTARFLWQARLAELETLLALGVLWAYVAFDAAIEASPGRSRALRFAAFHAATGFAFAVKGPIALLLVLPGAVAGALATRRGRALVSGACLGTLPFLPLLALPWYAAVVLRDRAHLDTFLAFARGENVGHLRGPLHYLTTWPLYGLPSVLATLPGLVLPFRRGTPPELARRLRLPFAAFALTFVLQSALAPKQTHYLIPVVYPMGAVLGGVWLDGALARASHGAAVLVRSGAALLVLAELVGVGWVVPRWNETRSPRPFFERVGRALPPGVRVGWSVFGSHSDWLYALPERIVGTRGIPDLAADTPAGTVARVRAFLVEAPPAYAITTAAEAAALGDVAEVVAEGTVGAKKRPLALVRTRAGHGDR
jgi:4-amino-4-deoxy-L-arabinose transferase-like glycosyltransferase